MKCGNGIGECQWDVSLHRYEGMKKTIAELIDELSITNIKVFFLIEKVHQDTHTKEDAKKIQVLNRYRSQLVNAINEFFNERQEVKV